MTFGVELFSRFTESLEPKALPGSAEFGDNRGKGRAFKIAVGFGAL